MSNDTYSVWSQHIQAEVMLFLLKHVYSHPSSSSPGNKFSSNHACVMVAGVWCYASVFAVGPLAWWGSFGPEPYGTACCINWYEPNNFCDKKLVPIQHVKCFCNNVAYFFLSICQGTIHPTMSLPCLTSSVSLSSVMCSRVPSSSSPTPSSCSQWGGLAKPLNNTFRHKPKWQMPTLSLSR